MKNIFKFFTLLISIMVATNSCDNSIYGCTDPIAKNYDDLADTDDNSCEYESTIMIWWDEDTEIEFYNTDVTDLVVSIDGSIVGNINNVDNRSWNTLDLSCENPNNIFEKDIEMPTSDNKTITIEVIDQDGYEIYNEVKTVSANTCHFYQIIW
jgi:hypothetical protein